MRQRIRADLAGTLAAAVLASALASAPPVVAVAVPVAQMPSCLGVRATIVGTAAADRLVGTPRADVIVGLAGDDRIVGRGGNDVVCGGEGNDSISGDAGADRLAGGPGRDVLYGGRGEDRLRGGTDNDRLWGGPGSDTLFGWRGDDRLHGGPGEDVANGGPGLDLCLSPPPLTARRCENTSLLGIDRGNGLAISSDGRFVAFAGIGVTVVDRHRGSADSVAVAPDGAPANDVSSSPTLSDDGARVAFSSRATNLVPNDTNGVADVFVRDIRAGLTTRVSVATDGTQAAHECGEERPSGDDGCGSQQPAMSADGRYIAFNSAASNLVPGDTNNAIDTFVRDTKNGVTTRVSVATDGTQATRFPDLLGSWGVAISRHGRYIAFASDATDLVPGDTNGCSDVFVHDMRTGVTSRITARGHCADGGGSGISAMTPDGRYVVFTNDVGVFLTDRDTGARRRVSILRDGHFADTSVGVGVSRHGRYVAFISDDDRLVPNDTNRSDDVFIRDMRTGTTTRVSLSTSGRQANRESHDAAFSADGRYVAFDSDATNLTPHTHGGIFVRIVR